MPIARLHRILLIYELSGLLSTTNPEASNTSLRTMHLSHNCLHFTFAPSFIYSQCKFKTIYIFLPSNPLYKNLSQLQGGGHVCLFHVALLVVVQAACPTICPFSGQHMAQETLSEELSAMKGLV